MPGRNASTSALHGTPGPGSYEVKGKKMHIGGRFSRDKRRSMSFSEGVPGPGAYEAQSKEFTAKQYSSRHLSSPRFTYSWIV